MTQPDPLGKRALFSAPEPEPETLAPAPGGGRRLALAVNCESCGVTTRLGLLQFLARHFPVWLWVPWRRHSRLMRCPACGKLAWQRVGF